MKKMPITAVPAPLFLPLEVVALGRLVTNIDQPLEGYYEPQAIDMPPSVKTEYTFTGQGQLGTKSDFGSALATLISVTFSKRSGYQFRIAPRSCKTYTLVNSDAWFDEALSSRETRKWIEEAAIHGKKIRLIVGIHTLIDTQLSQLSTDETRLQGQAKIPIALSLAAAGAIIPFAGLIDPSIQAETRRFGSNRASLFAPGEKICALQYRTIKYKWLSSKVVENLRLSETRQWSCMEGGTRNAYQDDNDDEDLIEVDIKDDGGPGDEWESQEYDEGLIYVHS